jgi:type IV secretion system protein VirB4
VGDVGHTLLVGATGSGKSTLVGFLIAQWQRYPRAKTFVFDVGYSHWLLGKAAGAQHYDIGGTSLDAVDSVALQPLADADRVEERAWAAEWIEMLLELQGVSMTPARRLRIDRALVLVAEQPREFRTLTELMVQLQDPALVDALRPYTVGGPFGRLLDGQHDAVREGKYQIFELKHLLDMGDKILVPVLLHLFRRVERQLDGAPALIVIEELWAALMRTVFTNRVRQGLLTLRKQNAAVLLVAHSLAQLDQVMAKQVLIESCPTKILLPNAEAGNSANARLYEDLGLNEREIGIVTDAVPKRDYYVKAPLGSRLVTLDLGPVGLAFLSTPEVTTTEGVRPVVEELAKRAGDGWPREWLRRRDLAVPDDPPPSDLERLSEQPTPDRGNGRSPRAQPREETYADRT